VLVINNYQVLLYNKLGLYGAMPLLLYACFDTWASVMNFINSLILDRFGRIRILAIGVIGCACSIILEAAMVATYAGGGNKVGNGFGVLFIYIFVTFYGGCMDVSTYVYVCSPSQSIQTTQLTLQSKCSEIFPTRVRAQGVGFSVSGLFLTALVYTESAPTAFNNIGWKYYLVFIFIPLFCVIILIKYLPETKGLTLEEVRYITSILPARRGYRISN
jgi:Sugar (and other) transporter